MLVAAISAGFSHAYDSKAKSRAPRGDVVLGQVFNMGMPGLRYPSKFLGYSTFSENPQLQNELTPTGIRQHYFIGNEYRERYVYEAELLADLYNI